MFASLLAILLLADPVPAPAAPAAPVPVRVVTSAPQGTPWEQVFEHIRRDMNATGKVRLKIEYGAKDPESALAAALARGEIDMLASTTAGLAGQLPALEALELPFLFDGQEEADFVLDNYLREAVATRAREHGLVFWNWSENGWQNYATVNHPILAPTDLMGLRMRSQPSPMHLIAWQTFGAVPVPMDPSEVPAAFKAGKLDGCAQSPVYMFAKGWQNAVHHLTLSHHLFQPVALVYSRKFFDAQSPDVQKVLTTNALAYAQELRKLVRGLEPESIAAMQKQGLQVHPLSPQDRAAFVSVARRVQNKFVSSASPEAMELLNTIVKAKAAFAKRP